MDGPLFTGRVRTRPPSSHQGPIAGVHWAGWPEVRADLRSSLRLVLSVAVAGAPAGLAWWGLAPRADFRITSAGPEPLGAPSVELQVAGDAVFVAVLAVVGLAAGLTAWRLRRRRGVATTLALAVGGSLSGVMAWQVGELLGPGPTPEQLADVGAVVTTSLSLGSAAALAVAPFMAVLGYVVLVLTVHDEGLGRTGEVMGADPCPPATGPLVPDAGRPLADVPPGGGPAV